MTENCQEKKSSDHLPRGAGDRLSACVGRKGKVLKTKMTRNQVNLDTEIGARLAGIDAVGPSAMQLSDVYACSHVDLCSFCAEWLKVPKSQNKEL